MIDNRRYAPATGRNREPIAAVLGPILPDAGLVLEVASGTGEHVIHFAQCFQALDWQPSDPSADARASIAGWLKAEGPANVRAPLALDAAAEGWPIDRADAIVCINMIHISPWEATVGLLRGAGRILPPDAPLYLYGPYRRGARPLEPSNAGFDENLRSRDPRWGLREVDDVIACAAEYGLAVESVIEMPANNLSIILRRLGNPG